MATTTWVARVRVVPLVVLGREAGPRLWSALPVLLVASLPMAVGVVVTAAFAFGGAVLLTPLVGALTLGPAFQLLTAVAGDGPVVRVLPGMFVRAIRPGVIRAVPIAVVGTLVVVSLAVRSAGFTASLAVNLTALGAALIVAPFAYTAGGWRRGAGLAAASPTFVLALLTLVALASGVAKLVGPPFLLLLPTVVAVATVTQVHLLTKEIA